MLDDDLRYHVGRNFSTRDQDNDGHPGFSCAQRYKGAWWYGACHDSNLNGAYLRGVNAASAEGVVWQHWRGDNYSLKFTEMKFRPFDY